MTTHHMVASCVRLERKAANAAEISPVVEGRTLSIGAGEVLVDIHAAGVNPSDAKAALGLMPYAVFPRTPGRDFAGVVVEGPADWKGAEVFGSSGDLGIRRDGTHATHLVVEPSALVRVPAGVSLREAAGIGVPFVTAQEGFRRAGAPKPGDVVLIMGVNGKVGQAAAQIAGWRGARVLGVVRRKEPYAGHGRVEVIDASSCDVAERVRELTGGHGADIVFNTVGDPYYAAATSAMAKAGRQILIAAVDRIVPFDIFAFYRGRHTYVGIDTLALTSAETADVLRDLVPGFAAGALRPYPILPSAVLPLARAGEAYRAVLGAERNRIVLDPKGQGA